jgi:hypothetical protein
MSADEIYRKLVSKEGLFGKAFFGHKKTKQESRRLNYLWKRAMKLAAGGNATTT